jgi:small basic protein
LSQQAGLFLLGFTFGVLIDWAAVYAGATTGVGSVGLAGVLIMTGV